MVEHGVIVVDKPSGMTSARVVSIVKRSLGVKKIGHTGTLDPMATGVLPLCIGEGTKIAGYLLAEDKYYEGEFLLGAETDTLDREGKITSENPDAAKLVIESQILSEMAKLTGPIEQIPPMFSALKKDGKRLHTLARAGKVVEREPRSIIIHSFELLSFSEGRGTFSVHASKGTYVRSLVLDLGRGLGCGAHLTELRRTKSGQFDLAMAIPLKKLQESAGKYTLVDPSMAIGHLPHIIVSEDQAQLIADGKRLLWRDVSDEPEPKEVFAIRTPSGTALLAIAEIDEERLRFRRVFNYGLTRRVRSSNLPAEIV